LRRILLRLVVVAVMSALVLAMAAPAYAQEGATVVPKICTEFGGGSEPFERCVHRVITPSGNASGWTTVEGRDPNQAPESRIDFQINPSGPPV
jgi:hypothetical protein